MSFNQIIFNTAPFDHSQSESDISLDLEALETVDAFIGVSTNVKLFCIPFERVDTEVHPISFRKIESFVSGGNVTGREVLGYTTAIDSVFWLDMEARENIALSDQISHLYKISFVSGSEKIDHKVTASKRISIASLLKESVSHFSTPYCRYRVESAAGNELVSQVTSSDNVEEIACMLDLTLQPGERLIVDAENYNVFVNGVNMIHTQKGRWIDELSRDTVSIVITAAEGGAGLTADILYTERWL